MPRRLLTHAVGRATRRIPGLRQVPVVKLLVIAEIILLAREHVYKLEPHERHRLVELLRLGRGRPSRLSPTEREELAALIEKTEPRFFAGTVAAKLSPLPLPRRVVRGPRRR